MIVICLVTNICSVFCYQDSGAYYLVMDPNQLTKDFFVKPNPILTIAILIGLFGHIPVMALKPEILPQFGPYGKLLHDFAQTYPDFIWNFFYYCMIIHAGEAILAFFLAGIYHQLNVKTTLKWTLSTFIHGVFSLRHLIR